MLFTLVRFTDGIYYIAKEKELRKKVGTEASVCWKGSKTFYLAEILEESEDKKKLMQLKEEYELGDSKNESDIMVESKDEKEISIHGHKSDKLIWDELQCDIPFENILDFENNNSGTENDASPAEKKIKEKINIISVKTIIPAKETCEIKYESKQHIPFEHIVDFTRNNSGTENVASPDRKNEEKINTFYGKTVIPEEETGKMKYEPKQQFCFFCEKLVRRFGRHLTTVHKNEGEVQKIISHGKKSELRRKLIDQLRTKGNYMYNHGDNKSPRNIVARRPINKQCPKEYMDCPICFVRLSKVSIRRHIRKCNPSNLTRKRSCQVDSKRVTFDLHKMADPILKEHVFPVLKNDLCTQVLRKDILVILYGNKLVAKYTSSHHHKMIRANLRYIGKYIIEMRNLTGEITDFMSCFSPKYYDHSVTAIREIAGYDREKGEFRAPYSASAIGTILKFCCAILESYYIKSQDESKIPEVQNFLKLLQTELSTDINKTVTENLTSIRRSKKVVLPTVSDMAILMKYLRSQRDESFRLIIIKFSFDLWRKMASFTLVGIMVYNGRRPGEIQRILISDFMESSQSSHDNPDLFRESTVRKMDYTRCVLRGKLGRNVSIVLSEEEVNCIKCILSYRELAGVNKNNPYVFGLPSQEPFKFLNAGDLLKKFADEAGVQYPTRLFATNIRKNLATKTTKLSLGIDEKEHVMNFMGHSETIHKTIYRQPDMEKDIAIMPKILDFASGSGEIPLNDISTNSNIQGLEALDEKNVIPCTENSDEKTDSDCTENYMEIEEICPRRKKRLIDMSLGYVSRRSWTTEERNAVRHYFKENIECKSSPTLHSCKSVVIKCDALRNRTAAQLKAWVNNQIKEKKTAQCESGFTRKSWSTPEKRRCREIFGEYVERGFYPSTRRINDAIEKYPELQNRTPAMIMAHLQHAMKKTSYVN
ncbi:hypothetical protein JTB14_019895 [Gonioctena quinquepunctata]|nr:hypothetical protein JTB14_019895 [Gonioctena quinquepunctata]